MLATLAGELSGDDEAASSQGTPRWVAGASLAGVVILLGGGYLLKDQIKVCQAYAMVLFKALMRLEVARQACCAPGLVTRSSTYLKQLVL
jgi:hypothetical protein